MQVRTRLTAVLTCAFVGALAFTAAAGARSDAAGPTAKAGSDAATAIS